VFFVLSLLAAFLYNRKYRKISVNDRIIEQKLIEILSVMVIFFNDPFYPITVLKENMVRYAFLMIEKFLLFDAVCPDVCCLLSFCLDRIL
jgi:hypothetical protein